MEKTNQDEELELFLLKRKILYQLDKIDKDEEFIVSIGLTGGENIHE